MEEKEFEHFTYLLNTLKKVTKKKEKKGVA